MNFRKKIVVILHKSANISKNIEYFRGKDYIVGLELCLRHCSSVVFVMPYMRHDKFSVSLHFIFKLV